MTGRDIDGVIAEKQAEYEALERETSAPMGLYQLAAKQARKATLLRELDALMLMRKHAGDAARRTGRSD